MKKILLVASEADPFIKTGGLGDVAYALPKYLRRKDVDIRVVIPKYKNIAPKYAEKLQFVKAFGVWVGWRHQHCGIFKAEADGVTYYLIDNEYYFKREGLYGYYDDGERFAFFDRAVLEMLKEIDWQPDIIHCNDWQTGMIPVLKTLQYSYDPFYSNMKTVYSIHNLLFQGNFDPSILQDLFGWNDEQYTNGNLEFYGAVSFMKGGILFCDRIVTVSPSYAEEIKTPFYGEKMDGLLREQSWKLRGILNGIDYGSNDPANDELIYEKYDVNSLEKKTANKLRLQQELGLPVREDIPMLGIVSRLTPQKGMDIMMHIMESVLNQEVQLVVLGTGDHHYEEYFKYLQHKYPHKVSANILFNNALAHKIYAASDIFLMPSLFEPCGLGQLIALRYGALPLVRETGGLRDTVRPYNKYTGEGNGFSFQGFSAHELEQVIDMAIACYKSKEQWLPLVKQAMESNNSWERSALVYLDLYNEL